MNFWDGAVSPLKWLDALCATAGFNTVYNIGSELHGRSLIITDVTLSSIAGAAGSWAAVYHQASGGNSTPLLSGDVGSGTLDTFVSSPRWIVLSEGDLVSCRISPSSAWTVAGFGFIVPNTGLPV